MKIVLALTNGKGSTERYMTEDGLVHTRDEMVAMVKMGQVPHMHVVNRNGKEYIRVNRKDAKLFAIDPVTLQPVDVLSGDYAQKMYEKAALTPFWSMYQKRIAEADSRGVLHVALEKRRYLFAVEEDVHATFSPLIPYILDAGRSFSIDPYLLGAIIIDEIVRLAPFEALASSIVISFVNKDISVGPAQVKIETARTLIKKKYYNPNPHEERFDDRHIRTVARRILYPYVVEAKHNIHFGAAHMRHIYDTWKQEVNLALPHEIVATLYSIGTGTPKKDPKPNIRGLQIVHEFLPLAKKWMQ